MTQYSGLCIGGPLDGKWLVQPGHTVIVEVRKVHVPLYAPEEREAVLDAEPEARRVTYVHQKIGVHSVWLVHGPQFFYDAVGLLLSTYEEHCNGRTG